MCNFTMHTDVWAMPWVVSLKLLLKDRVGCVDEACVNHKVGIDLVTSSVSRTN